jgi:hypothetical protein
MIVVPIARDRCFFYRKFLFTLGRVSLVAIVSCGALAASCGLYTQAAVLPPVGGTSQPCKLNN